MVPAAILGRRRASHKKKGMMEIAGRCRLGPTYGHGLGALFEPSPAGSENSKLGTRLDLETTGRLRGYEGARLAGVNVALFWEPKQEGEALMAVLIWCGACWLSWYYLAAASAG